MKDPLRSSRTAALGPIEPEALKNWPVRMYPPAIRTADQKKPFTRVTGSLTLEPAGSDTQGRYAVLRGEVSLAKGDDNDSAFQGTLQAVLAYRPDAPEVQSLRGVVEGDAMVDRFPGQFHCLPFFRIQDNTASPPLDQHLVRALKKEFWSGQGEPQVGLLQENLSAGGPNAARGSVLIQEKANTYIMLQAIESWAKPTQGFAGAVRQGSPADAIQRGYEIFDCRYFEIYMNDLLHADYAAGFEKWHAFLHRGGPRPALTNPPKEGAPHWSLPVPWPTSSRRPTSRPTWMSFACRTARCPLPSLPTDEDVEERLS